MSLKVFPLEIVKWSLIQVGALHQANIKAMAGLRSGKNIQQHNRHVRLTVIKKLFWFMDMFSMADYEQGAAAHYNDLAIIANASYAVKAFDAQVVQQCASSDCKVFFNSRQASEKKREEDFLLKEGCGDYDANLVIWNLAIEVWEDPRP